MFPYPSRSWVAAHPELFGVWQWKIQQQKWIFRGKKLLMLLIMVSANSFNTILYVYVCTQTCKIYQYSFLWNKKYRHIHSNFLHVIKFYHQNNLSITNFLICVCNCLHLYRVPNWCPHPHPSYFHYYFYYLNINYIYLVQ